MILVGPEWPRSDYHGWYSTRLVVQLAGESEQVICDYGLELCGLS